MPRATEANMAFRLKIRNVKLDIDYPLLLEPIKLVWITLLKLKEFFLEKVILHLHTMLRE